MTFLHAHTQYQALKQWLAAACEMASKTNMAMQQSKCTIRTHCCRAQQTHKSQQRFPVNKKCTHTHTLYAHISVQKYPSKAAYTRTIIDHHYASFKFYANHISWSLAKKGKKGKQTNQERTEQTIHPLLTKHIEFEECVGPLR